MVWPLKFKYDVFSSMNTLWYLCIKIYIYIYIYSNECIHPSQRALPAQSLVLLSWLRSFHFWWLHWRGRQRGESFPRRDKCFKTQLEHQNVALNGACKWIYLAAVTLQKCSYSKLRGKWVSCTLGSLGREGLCWHKHHQHNGKAPRWGRMEKNRKAWKEWGACLYQARRSKPPNFIPKTPMSFVLQGP